MDNEFIHWGGGNTPGNNNVNPGPAAVGNNDVNKAASQVAPQETNTEVHQAAPTTTSNIVIPNPIVAQPAHNSSPSLTLQQRQQLQQQLQTTETETKATTPSTSSLVLGQDIDEEDEELISLCLPTEEDDDYDEDDGGEYINEPSGKSSPRKKRRKVDRLAMVSSTSSQDSLSSSRDTKMSIHERREIQWQAKFAELKEHYAKHGNPNVSESQNRLLSKWCWWQKQRKRLGTLSLVQKEQLDALGFDWGTNATYSKPKVSANSPKIPKNKRSSLADSQMSKLPQPPDPSTLTDSLRKKDSKWDSRFEELEQFKQKYGNCDVPVGYNDSKLYNWVCTQRKMLKKGNLRSDRYQKLNALGFNWAQKTLTGSKRSRDGFDNGLPNSVLTKTKLMSDDPSVQDDDTEFDEIISIRLDSNDLDEEEKISEVVDTTVESNSNSNNFDSAAVEAAETLISAPSIASSSIAAATPFVLQPNTSLLFGNPVPVVQNIQQQ